jgi:geranylgeranyl pyrophosphate synthase
LGDVDGGDSTLRNDAAAIVELYMAAGFLLDDVMDDDVPAHSSIGIDAALGTAVLMIANAALDEAAEALPATERTALKMAAQRLVLAACDGQLRELRLTGDAQRLRTMSVDDAMALTEDKAGSLGELAAVVGAGLAGGFTTNASGAKGADVTAALRGCYYHYVTYVQMVDDLTDAVDDGAGAPGDIAQGRPTVPSVYFYKNASYLRADLGADTEVIAPTVNIISARDALVRPDADQLRESGTTPFTQLAAEMQRKHAIAAATQIQAEHGGAEALLGLFGAGQGADSEAKLDATTASPGSPST